MEEKLHSYNNMVIKEETVVCTNNCTDQMWILQVEATLRNKIEGEQNDFGNQRGC